MQSELPPTTDFWGLLVTLIISFASGFISVSRRILAGQAASVLWIITEFTTAIMCGYLMYSSYPALQPYMPGWVTPIVAVAVSAHIGGRVFQEIEAAFWRKYSKFIPPRE